MADESKVTGSDRLSLLKSRLAYAKTWTKKAHEAWRTWIKEYEIDDWADNSEVRDKVRVGYLFRKSESELPAVFDDQPDIFIKGRHANTDVIVPLIEGAYDFLWDVQRLEEVIEQAGLYFEVIGMGFIKSPWVTRTEQVVETVEIPVMSEDGMTPAVDELGQPMTMPEQQVSEVPTIDWPVAKAPDPFKLYFSSETRFSARLDYEHCPYYLEEMVMTAEEVKARFGKSVEANETLKVNDTAVDAEVERDSKVIKDDLKRVTVYEYYGCLPKEHAPKGSQWAYDKDYHAYFTNNEELLVEECPYEVKPLFVLGNYGMANKFFKFGDAKHLMPLIQELQAYRTLILKHLRKNANPKPMVPTTANVDEDAFRDPRGDRLVKYDGQTPPSYLQPPNLSPVVGQGIEVVRTDLEKTAGSFDLAMGAGQSTVRTPKGIEVYGEAADRNVRTKRKKVARFIRELLIFQLSQIGANWKPEDGRTLTILANNQPELVEVTAEVLEVLRGVNSMYQLDIEAESLSVNRQQMRSDGMELMNLAATNPDIFNRMEIAKWLLQSGFNLRDGDRFLATPEEQLASLMQQFPQQAQALMGQMMAEQIAPGELPMGGEGNAQASQPQPVAPLPAGNQGSGR